MIIGLDHVQISIPAGRLDEALRFYADTLGFVRVPKPAELSPTGAWLTGGTLNLHLGEEAHFATDGRAHPALMVADAGALIERCAAAGYRHRWDEGPAGYLRGSVFDPFGNRVELMQKLS
ncbi:MAG TPA: VOC family protein [Burkholderiaceae bacterium]|nr:VOC family protein [Burkholderiaceae bacterium]